MTLDAETKEIFAKAVEDKSLDYDLRMAFS